MRPHRQQPTRLLRPWDSPGKNTGVGCHFLLQCMKVKSESEVTQSCLTLSDPMDYSPPGPPSMGFSRQEYWSGVPLPSPIHYRGGTKWVDRRIRPLEVIQPLYVGTANKCNNQVAEREGIYVDLKIQALSHLACIPIATGEWPTHWKSSNGENSIQYHSSKRHLTTWYQIGYNQSLFIILEWGKVNFVFLVIDTYFS